MIGDNQETFSPPEKTGLGSLLAAAGLDRPAAQKAATKATSPFVTFSLERLADHDGDVLFLLTGGPYDPAKLKASPLWNRLRAVKDESVHEVSGET